MLQTIENLIIFQCIETRFSFSEMFVPIPSLLVLYHFLRFHWENWFLVHRLSRIAEAVTLGGVFFTVVYIDNT